METGRDRRQWCLVMRQPDVLLNVLQMLAILNRAITSSRHSFPVAALVCRAWKDGLLYASQLLKQIPRELCFRALAAFSMEKRKSIITWVSRRLPSML